MSYTLENMIDLVNAIPGLVEQAAPRVSVVIEEYLEKTIRAGTTPYGEPWKLTKKGAKPLPKAFKKLSVDPVGSKIYVRLRFPYSLHDTGEARGRTKRQVLPAPVLPVELNRQISEAIAYEYETFFARKAG